MQALRIGVISDTHGLLRPEALTALQGTDHIIHAGDVGNPAILDALAAVAPVTAVRGNVDRGAWAQALPETNLLAVGGISIYVLHAIDDLDLVPESADISAVIYGHSHQPEIRTRNGVLYLNPGSAGPRRFRLPISLAILTIEEDRLTPTLVTLAPDLD